MGDICHVDEVFITLRGQRRSLWRTVNWNGDVIELPVTRWRDHRAALILSQIASGGRIELRALLPNALGRNHDASLIKEILDVAKAQREPVVELNGVADDFGWKAVASIQ